MKMNNDLIEILLNVDLLEFVELARKDRKLQLELIKLQDMLHFGSNTYDPSILKRLKKLDVKKLIQIFTLIDQVESRGSVSCVSQILNFYKSLPETGDAEFDEILDWV